MTHDGGLVVTLRVDESVALDDGRLTVVDVGGGQVKLLLSFPRDVAIGDITKRPRPAASRHEGPRRVQ